MNQQHAASGPIREGLCPVRDPLPHRVTVPLIVADELLKILVVNLPELLSETLHVFARNAAQKTGNIRISVGTEV